MQCSIIFSPPCCGDDAQVVLGNLKHKVTLIWLEESVSDLKKQKSKPWLHHQQKMEHFVLLLFFSSCHLFPFFCCFLPPTFMFLLLNFQHLFFFSVILCDQAYFLALSPLSSFIFHLFVLSPLFPGWSGCCLFEVRAYWAQVWGEYPNINTATQKHRIYTVRQTPPHPFSLTSSFFNAEENTFLRSEASLSSI